jgi:uncharacterized protein YbcC (UPF0753/DUF2309 family)
MGFFQSKISVFSANESKKSVFQALVNSKFVKKELLEHGIRELTFINATYHEKFRSEVKFYKNELLELTTDNSEKFTYFPNDQLSIYHARNSQGIRYQIIICDPEELWHSAVIFWIGLLK